MASIRTVVVLALLLVSMSTSCAHNAPDSPPHWIIQKLSNEPLDTNAPQSVRIQAAAHIGDTTLVVAGTRLRDGERGRAVVLSRAFAGSAPINDVVEITSRVGVPSTWIGVIPTHGGFTVLWSDVREAGAGIYMRRVLPSGIPAGDERRIDPVVVADSARIVLIGRTPTLIWGGGGMTRLIMFDNGTPRNVVLLPERYDSLRVPIGYANELIALNGGESRVLHEDGSIEQLPSSANRFRCNHYEWADSTFAYVDADSVYVLSSPFAATALLSAPLDSVAPASRVASFVVRDALGYHLVMPDAVTIQLYVDLHLRVFSRGILPGRLSGAQMRYDDTIRFWRKQYRNMAFHLLRSCDGRTQIIYRYTEETVTERGDIVSASNVATPVDVFALDSIAVASGVGVFDRWCRREGSSGEPVAAVRIRRDSTTSVTVDSGAITLDVPWDRLPVPVPQVQPVVGVVDGRLQVGWLQQDLWAAMVAERPGPEDSLHLVWQSTLSPYAKQWSVQEQQLPNPPIQKNVNESLQFSMISTGISPVLMQTLMRCTDYGGLARFVDAELRLSRFTDGEMTSVSMATRIGGTSATPPLPEYSIVEMASGGLAAAGTSVSSDAGGQQTIAIRGDWTMDTSLTTAVESCGVHRRLVPVSDSTIAAIDTNRIRVIGRNGVLEEVATGLPESHEQIVRLREPAFLRLINTESDKTLIERYRFPGLRESSTVLTLPGIERSVPSVFEGWADRRIYVVWGASDGVRMRILHPNLTLAEDTLIVPRPVSVWSASGVIINGGLALAWCDTSDGDLDVYAMVPFGDFGPPRDTTSAPPVIDTAHTDIPLAGISVRPTPSGAVADISFAGSEGVDVLTVYDLQGGRVLTMEIPPQKAGPRSVPLDVGQMPPGTYVVTVEGGGRRLNGRLLISAER